MSFGAKLLWTVILVPVIFAVIFGVVVAISHLGQSPTLPPARLTGSWSGTYHGADVSGNLPISLTLVQDDGFGVTGTATITTAAGTKSEPVAGSVIAGVAFIPAGGTFVSGAHFILSQDRTNIDVEWKDAKGVALSGTLNKQSLSTAGASGTWYIHWSCGSSTQCAQVWGAATGIKANFQNKDACEAVRTTWASNNTMQKQTARGAAGSWCSQSKNVGDIGP
jgi:hypothetical protein